MANTATPLSQGRSAHRRLKSLKAMKIKNAALLVMLLLIQPLPAAVSSAPSGDLERLKAAGQLRVAVFATNYPPFFFEKNGELTGSEIDLARDLAASIGLQPVFTRIAGTPDDVIRAVADGRAELAVSGLVKSMPRSQTVLFSRPYMNMRLTLLVNRLSLARLAKESRAGKANPLQLFNDPQRTITAMAGTTMQSRWIPDLFPKARRLSAGNWREAGDQVRSGRADAAVIPEVFVIGYNILEPEAGFKTQTFPLGEYPMMIAVRHDLPELLRLVNDFLDITEEHRRGVSLHDLVLRYTDDTPGINALVKQMFEDKAEPAAAPINWMLLAALHTAAIILGWLVVARSRREGHWLLSPFAILTGLVLGGATGAAAPSLAQYAGPPADIYLGFWRLCVLPIMVATVFTSIYRLLDGGGNTHLMRRLLLAIPAALILITLTGVLAGIWGRPGASFPPASQALLAKSAPEGGKVAGKTPGVYEQVIGMARSIVPDNPLKPVAENQNLAVLFITVFFSVVLARARVEGRETVVKAVDTIGKAFTQMIKSSIYLLPFALYALTLAFVGRMGFEFVGAVLRLIALAALAMLLPLLFAVVALRRRLGEPLGAVLHRFAPMFLMALSARSSVMSMPLGLEALRSSLKVNREQALAVFPVTLLICHSTYAVFFGLMPVFIGQVFGVTFSLGQYLFIVMGAMLSTFAAVGTIGLSYVMLLAIVCTPLGLPLEPAVLAGTALVALLDPAMSAIQALFGCGMTAMIVDKSARP